MCATDVELRQQYSATPFSVHCTSLERADDTYSQDKAGQILASCGSYLTSLVLSVLQMSICPTDVRSPFNACAFLRPFNFCALLLTSVSPFNSCALLLTSVSPFDSCALLLTSVSPFNSCGA
jgi:hypothetical protein